MSIITVLQNSPALFISAVFLLGLTVGSFLNVLIHRLPIMMQKEWRQQAIDYLQLNEQHSLEPKEKYNLVKPDSHCPNCNHKIRWYENIPLLSYLFLKGKCSNCKTSISLRYPFIELLTGLLSALVAYKFGFSAQTLAALFLVWGVVSMVGIDYDHQLLPDSLTLPLLWLGLIVNLNGTFVSLPEAVIGAAAGYLSLWSIYWLFKLLTGKEGMGYGDFKMFAMVGAWLGWKVLPLTLLLSAVVGLMVMLPQMLFLGRDKAKAFAFGPFIGIAGLVMLLYAEPLLKFIKYM